jgi:hypothetical protein
MSLKTIHKHAADLGLTIETVFLPKHENAFRVFKGAKQLFIGTESAVEVFLNEYERERPGPMEGSMYDYRE